MGLPPFFTVDDLITEIPQSFLDEFENEVLGTIPQEKAQADLRAASIGKMLLDDGPLVVEGLGQKLGEVDARTWFRWNSEFPGCWQNREFVHEFFKDNPQYRAPGWTPKTNPHRHGIRIGGI